MNVRENIREFQETNSDSWRKCTGTVGQSGMGDRRQSSPGGCVKAPHTPGTAKPVRSRVSSACLAEAGLVCCAGVFVGLGL